MAKPLPTPRQPASARTVAGIAVTIAALVLGVPAVLVVTQPHAQPDPAQAPVARYLAALEARDPAARHRDAARKAQELAGLMAQSDFEVLPQPIQDRARGRLEELTAYLAYEKQVNALPALDNLTTVDGLHQLQDQLVKVTMPANHELEWKDTDAGRRHDALRQDVLALGAAVGQVSRDYQKLIDAATAVLRDPNGEMVPSRAQAILDRAAKLPTAQSPGSIPGSNRLGYGVVFRFKDVVEAYRPWPPLRDKLKALAALHPPGGEKQP
jgi:hypothetical protein